MNSNLNEKLGMYLKVQGYLRLNAVETAGVPAIASGLTELDAVINEILNTAGQASMDLTGFTEQKARVKKDLVNMVSGISNVFATITRQNRTNLKFTKSHSALGVTRDSELYTYAMQLHAAALPFLVDFAPFGVTSDKMNRLSSLAQQFLAAMETPTMRRNMRKTSNEKLPKLFQRADDLLKVRLDAGIEQFRSSGTSLFDGYWNVRQIDHSGHRSSPDFEDTVPPASIHLAAEMEYEPGRTFRIRNTGEDVLYVALSSNPEKMEGKIIVVEPKTTIERKSSNLNEIPANYLLVENRNPHFPVSYKISVFD